MLSFFIYLIMIAIIFKNALYKIIIHPILFLLSATFVRLLRAFIFCIIFSNCTPALKIKDANTAMQWKQYALASMLYPIEIAKEKNSDVKAAMVYNLALAHQKLHNTELAIAYYDKAIKSGYGVDALLSLALMQKQNNDYVAAINNLKRYDAQQGSDHRAAMRELKACKDALQWLHEDTGYKVENNKQINTSFDEHGMASDYKNKWIFTSNRATQLIAAKYDWNLKNYFDLYEVALDRNTKLMGSVRDYKEINSPFNEGNASFTSDGKRMYFSRCGSDNKANDYCKIFECYETEPGKWSEPEELKLIANDTLNLIQPYISPNGKRLYFACDDPNGIGAYDILYSDLLPVEGWQTAKNLGASINTESNDLYPTLDADGNLFFSTDGWLGMGGLDIFKTNFNGKKYEIFNLHAPINSAADDFSFVLEPLHSNDKKDSILSKGYLSSNRAGGVGGDDIYNFIQKKPKLAVKKITYKLVVITQQLDQRGVSVPLQATTQVRLLPDTLLLKVDEQVSNKSYFTINEKNDYMIQCNAEGYLSVTSSICAVSPNQPIDGVITIEQLVVLQKIEKGSEILLEDIFYDYDSTRIRSDAKVGLDRLIKILKDNPTIQIELGSHTDCRGDSEYNATLSQGRAESAVVYMIEKGINKERLNAKGYGESLPKNEGIECKKCTEADHQMNRRTSFKIL